MHAILRAVAPYAAFMVAADGIMAVERNLTYALSATTLDLADTMRVVQDVITYKSFQRCDIDTPTIYTMRWS